MERSKPATQSSTYGQACTHCYKAKSRCVRTPNGDKCFRLKKRCQPSESVRRRNAQMAEESDTRIARLENKMEILLSAMQSLVSQGASGTSANTLQSLQPVHSLDGNSISSSTSYSNGTLVNTSAGLTGSIATASPHPNLLFSSHHYSLPSSVPSPNQADERLDFFRSRMLPYFPFISLTPDMTSSYLRQNRPFLFQAIYTVTIFSIQERLTQVEELKRVLFTSALLEVQSNIDLLLGLLTYLAWSTDAFLGRADLVSRLMMLAISLVYDLRLFKPSSPDVQVMMSITQGRDDDITQSPNDQMPDGFLEKQRALLACFVLSSNVSSHLGRQDAIRWTSQMEEALSAITLSKSCPADELFVFQVRLQLLKQRADYVRQQEETDYARTGTAPAAASGPRFLYLKTLRVQLHELRSSFSPDLQHIGQTGRIADGGTLLDFQRLECLWQSVENIKSWLDEFYRIPCSKLVGQPFHLWSQMILSVTLLKYLSTLKDPEWDCEAVRSTVDLTSTMECMAQKLDQSSKDPELQCDDHLLKLLTKLLTKCRLWAEARWTMASQLQDVATRPCGSANSETTYHNHHIPDLDQMTWMQSMDLGDDQWLEGVLGIPTTFY
ncbi:hypothetical protein PENSOL_c041G03361 [Penicillium solitum]|uniref:Zn(2)-C6 fungal-type domain-containing protein n=1 Tax=Penicillium solitum TaxID=60172 RepID=A0A1V6QU65_9EURO|nr:uncharacterized protein PENSOL_c041G03361 [Penicillium solitum]OQD92492.1 hypothetical protein PENSOL_c041G03361 [Penicillium solitum]